MRIFEVADPDAQKLMALSQFLSGRSEDENAKKVLLFTNTSHEDIEKVAKYYDIIIEFKAEIIYLDEIFYEFLSIQW